MARAAGSKVVTCPNAKCDARICGIPGESVQCKKCGTKVRLTKAILAAESEKKGAPVQKQAPAKSKKIPVAAPVKRGRKPKAG
jgi:hypothetical protein